MKNHLLSFVLVLAPALAVAGGSFEPVVVESFKTSGSTSYTLVVRPQSTNNPGGYSDPYLGGCSKVTIHGTYSALYSAIYFPEFVTRSNHKEALSHLEQAQVRGTVVNFGWIGSGLAPFSSESKCVYRSRALLLETQRGNTAVLSLYNPV